MSVISNIVRGIASRPTAGVIPALPPRADHGWLISHIERLADPDAAAYDDGLQQCPYGSERFVGMINVENGMDFSFHCPCPHVPELLLIEAGRQMAVGIARKFYRLPLRHAFMTTELAVEFRSTANRTDTLTAHTTLGRQSFRQGRLVRMSADNIIRQRQQTIARVAGTFVLVDNGTQCREAAR